MKSILAAALLLTASIAGAADPKLAWDGPTKTISGEPITNTLSYELGWGTETANYTNLIEVGTNTTMVVSNVPLPAYFAVRSLGWAGMTSSNSAMLMLPSEWSKELLVGTDQLEAPQFKTIQIENNGGIINIY